MLRTTFEYNLSAPFSRHAAGQNVEITSLLLTAPSNKDRAHTAKLKQGFYGAIKNMQNSRGEAQAENSSSDGMEMDGDAVYSILMMGCNDYGEYLESFRSLLLSQGICKLNGEYDMLANDFDKMLDADTEALLGEYLANFLMSLWTRQMKKK